jgi:hypothetical protein
MPITHVTPQVLAELYAHFSNDDKIQTLRLIGQQSTAEAPFCMVAELPLVERGRFAAMTCDELARRFQPVIVRQTLREVAAKHPALSDELRREEEALQARVDEALETYARKINELTRAKAKRDRDRKLDPDLSAAVDAFRALRSTGLSRPQAADRVHREHPEWFPDLPAGQLTKENRKQLVGRLRQADRRRRGTN